MERVRILVIVTVAAALLYALPRASAAQPAEPAGVPLESPRDEDWAPQRFKGFEWISDFQAAQSVDDRRIGPLASKQSPADKPPINFDAKSAESNSPSANNSGSKTNANNNRPDAALVSQGQTAFNSDCTQCHDAERSTSKSKSLAEWKATVARMASKDGANVPSGDRDAIANYLASLSSSASGGGGGAGGDSSAAAAPSASFTATIDPWWRGGGSSNLQRPGFFPDVWVGGAWQGSGPISGRVTACISCHNEAISRIELVEAAARFDLTKCLGCSCDDCNPRQVQASVEAGRFVVPFGAFYQQVNPGVFRTVTKPLIYNMGERVFPNQIGFPVLPMPYADEGVAGNVGVPIGDDLTLSFIPYLVNGLQGATNGIDFIFGSRDYTDNNRYPAGGARLSLGGKSLKLGTSIMGGRYNPDIGAGPSHAGLDYFIYGADATYRWEDILRVQFEYAQRDTDLFFFGFPDNAKLLDRIGGCYVEGEVLLNRCWHLSFVTRYDMQVTRTPSPPGAGLPNSVIDVRIFTFGLNWNVGSASLLMVGDDHWFMPSTLHDVDVVGVRWATTF